MLFFVETSHPDWQDVIGCKTWLLRTFSLVTDPNTLPTELSSTLTANAGGGDLATILPEDPDASAARLRVALGCGAVVVTDTFGRPWREGLVDVAIGVAGLDALDDYRGSADRHGRQLAGTIIAVADQLAAAAGLLMRKRDGCPVVLVRGFRWRAAVGCTRDLIRRPEQDLFR